MAPPFAVSVPDLAPPHQQGPNLRTLYGAIGAQLDANALQILNGRVAANPFAGGTDALRTTGARLADGRLLECEPYALVIHGYQRGIPLYETEGDLSKRIRLSQWLPLRRQKGTPRGELLHARPYFADSVAAGYAYPVMRIVHQDGNGLVFWHTMTSAGVYQVTTGSNFNFDGQTSKRSRYWVFVEMPGTAFTPPNTYGDGHTYGDGAVYGAGGARPFSAARCADVVQMFVDWKSAHSWLGGVILVWGSSINIAAAPVQDATGWWSLPNGKWGNIVDPSTGLGTRPPTYQWIYDNPA